MTDILTLHPDDDVALALRDLTGVPRGHKVAVHAIAAGAHVRKYGQVIGAATRPIEAGEHVHVHNLAVAEFARDAAFGADVQALPEPPAHLRWTFHGIRRPDDDMDVDCGAIINGSATVEEIGRRIYDAVLDVASGERTASECLGFGADEFVPWQLGAVM
jgi:altronate dehydratase